MTGLRSLRPATAARASAAVSCSFNGSIASGVVTNPGGVVAGLSVSVYVDGSATASGTATTTSDGSWSLTLGGLSVGVHTFQAKVSVQTQVSATGVVAGGSASAPGGGVNNTADHTDPNNAYLVNLGG